MTDGLNTKAIGGKVANDVRSNSTHSVPGRDVTVAPPAVRDPLGLLQ